MAKEPWEEDIYDDGEETLKRTSKLNGIKADRLLTILAIIFFVVVVAMVCLLIFLSTGGSNKSKQMSGFYMERLRLNRNHQPLQHKLTKRLKTIVQKMRTLKKVRSLFKQVKGKQRLLRVLVFPLPNWNS